jgi:hypothetical protein
VFELINERMREDEKEERERERNYTLIDCLLTNVRSLPIKPSSGKCHNCFKSSILASFEHNS